MARCLMIIDVQHGFINEWTRAMPARVEALQARYEHVIATRFVNPEGSPYRRLIRWSRCAPGSSDTVLAFAPRGDAWIYDKTVYSAVTPALQAFLDARGLKGVELAGIATDNCVLKTAVDLFEIGYRPVVLANACASHGGPECHDCGLRLLRRFIGQDQVVEAAP